MRGPSWPIFVMGLLRLSCAMAQQFKHDVNPSHNASSGPQHPASHVATGTTQVATASPTSTEHGHNTTGDVQTRSPPQVEPPIFSPDTKTFAVSVTVTMSCPTRDASIHYTTDGSTPGPHSLSIVNEEQLVWSVLGSTTFKAVAMKEGLRDSEVVEKEYVVVARAAAPVFGGVKNGGKYVGHVHFNISTPTEGAWICYTTTPTSMPDPEACEHRVLNGAVLSWSTIGTVVYRAIALRDGMAPSPVEELVFLVMGKVAAPIIQPSTSVFLKAATLVVTCPTPGAIIYWTADGSEPDPNAPDANALRTGDQIHHSKPGFVTIKAVAVREGMASSDVAVKKIKVMRQAAAPRFKFFSKDPFDADLPKRITFVLRANFTVTTTTPNATILYTTSGSMPRRKSSLTKEMKPGFHLTWTELGLTTLRAMAVAPDMADSRVTSLTLRIMRERFVTYPMHHVKEDFWLLTDDTADKGAEEAEESAPSRNATTEVQSNNTYATEQSPRPAGTPDVASEGGDEAFGETANRTVYMFAAVNDTDGWEEGGDDDVDDPESPAEAIGEYKNSTFPGSSATSPGSVNATRNSTLVPMPHKRYRKPLSIAGYEGVQPVVSIHVVEAQFKDCAYCNTRDVRGRFVTLDNPSKHFSILEQLGGCGSGIVLPSVSGRAYTLPPRPTYYLPAGFNSTQMKELNEWTDRQFDTVKDLGCQIVSNAGFFNTTSTDCFGHLVSQGKVIRTTTAHSASFGMRNGSYVVGYLKPDEVNNTANPFQEVISGVVWLVREGQNYVSESLEVEDMSIQETGAQFATVKSARTAIGHDSHGRLVILQIEGETWTRGVDLYEVADLLVELDVVNAINLDGGSSATMTQNHSLVSDPSWLCDQDNPKSLFRCEKNVASITCIHAAPPPIFVPVETTWANWTNITAAKQQAEALAAERAELEELSRVCALQQHLQQQQQRFGARGANATMQSWAFARDYRVGFWVILPLFVLSALLNMTMLLCCHKRSDRLSSTTVHAERLMLRSTDEGPWNDTTHENGDDARQRLGWRFNGTLYGLNASRSGKKMLSSSSAVFHRVTGSGDDVSEGCGDEEEVEVNLDGGGVGQNGGRSRAAMLPSMRRLRDLFAQRRAEDRLEGVREVELEVNPFLNGFKGVA